MFSRTNNIEADQNVLFYCFQVSKIFLQIIYTEMHWISYCRIS